MFGRNEIKKRAARAGFSLIVVLIVALIGLAIIGVAFFIYESSSGQTQITLQRSQEYNILQGGIERGKNHLISLVNNTDPVPRWNNNPANAGKNKITDPDMLIIENGTFTYSEKIHGDNVDVKVDIYDSNYNASLVDQTAMTAEKIAQMPPALAFTGGGMMVLLKPDEPGEDTSGADLSPNIGIYLIRATMTVDGETKTAETSVVQRNII